MSSKRKPVIAVIGAGTCSKELSEEAAAVGRYVARHGGVVVCGGKGGVMKGAARGAHEAGGVTIGILPSDDHAEANEFIDFAIPTGLGEVRNVLVVRSADAVVAFPGRYGTLSEMAFTLMAGKPLIAVRGYDLGPDVIRVDDPEEAARQALALAAERMVPGHE